MIVNPDGEVYTKTQNHRNTQRKTKKTTTHGKPRKLNTEK